LYPLLSQSRKYKEERGIEEEEEGGRRGGRRTNETNAGGVDTKTNSRALRKKFETKDFHKLRVPICQHNLYKYQPYYIHELIPGKVFFFP
jgi:hypothetical protein